MATRREVHQPIGTAQQRHEPQQFTLDHVRALLRAMDGSDVSSIHWERDDQRIRIHRGSAQPAFAAPAELVAPAPSAAYLLAAAAAVDPSSLASAPSVDAVPQPAAAAERPGVLVRTPLVGTFYRAPAPDAAPFVEVGSVVKKGQVLCIVEAMKVMNEIEAEAPGKVVEILAANAASVDQDQPLFRLEPV